MSMLEIPHDAFVFVGDGRKALFQRNAGDETSLNFRIERVFVDENPPTHHQGSDRPGRAFKHAPRAVAGGNCHGVVLRAVMLRVSMLAVSLALVIALGIDVKLGHSQTNAAEIDAVTRT